MLATLTSKGQVTLPKEIRDALKLDAGAKLDFLLQPDGSLTVRPLTRSVSAIVGLLKRPGRDVLSVDAMNTGVARHLADKHERIRRDAVRTKPARPPR